MRRACTRTDGCSCLDADDMDRATTFTGSSIGHTGSIIDAGGRRNSAVTGLSQVRHYSFDLFGYAVLPVVTVLKLVIDNELRQPY